MFLFYLEIVNKMRQVRQGVNSLGEVSITISEFSDICDGSNGRLYMQAHGKKSNSCPCSDNNSKDSPSSLLLFTTKID